MKIAITSEGNALDSPIDNRFGRAKGFIVFDTETEEFFHMDNTQNYQAAQGAGIQSARNILNAGADILITGHVGPKAFTTLNAADIEIFTGASGTVSEAISQYKSGKLDKARDADVGAHW